jgi:glycosyltransferase involved in cell wall biosynthesis
MEAELLQSHFRLQNNLQHKSYVVPNGIIPDLFEDLFVQANDFLAAYNCRDFVLEVARIEVAKNQLGLIEALFNIPVPIVLIGKPSPYESEYVARCQERARERGNVFFIEHIPYEKLPGAYAAASVHALPSWRETPGLTSLEAAAAGCKVVSTSLGCAQEYFGELAWYCHPADLSSISQAVIAALNTPSTTTLRQRVLEEFTWQQAAKVTYQAYCSVLEKNRANSISH